MGEEAKLEVGKDLVTLAQASRNLAESSIGRQDWSGLPIPVPGLRLVLEPRYKHKAMENFSWKECYDENGVRHEIPQRAPPQASEFRRVNSWWNAKYQLNITVLRDQEGRARQPHGQAVHPQRILSGQADRARQAARLGNSCLCCRPLCPIHSAFFCGMGGIPTEFRPTLFVKMLQFRARPARLSHRLAQDRPQLLRRGSPRVAQVDLVMLAVEFFSGSVDKFMHPLDRRSLI